VDRANAARKIMQNSGIKEQQVSQVRGFADQRPRAKCSPDDPANRRISLIVEYLAKDPPADSNPEAPSKAESSSAKPEAGEHRGAKE
jgi:chemotaxis protein MotB